MFIVFLSCCTTVSGGPGFEAKPRLCVRSYKRYSGGSGSAVVLMVILTFVIQDMTGSMGIWSKYERNTCFFLLLI